MKSLYFSISVQRNREMDWGILHIQNQRNITRCYSSCLPWPRGWYLFSEYMKRKKKQRAAGKWCSANMILSQNDALWAASLINMAILGKGWTLEMGWRGALCQKILSGWWWRLPLRNCFPSTFEASSSQFLALSSSDTVTVELSWISQANTSHLFNCLSFPDALAPMWSRGSWEHHSIALSIADVHYLCKIQKGLEE